MLDPAPARELPTALLRRLTWITPNETETQELLKTNIEIGDQGSMPRQIAFWLAVLRTFC